MSDESTMRDHIEDLMVEIAIVRSELQFSVMETNRFKDHAIHAWFCKETVCETCFDHFMEAKHGKGPDHE